MNSIFLSKLNPQSMPAFITWTSSLRCFSDDKDPTKTKVHQRKRVTNIRGGVLVCPSVVNMACTFCTNFTGHQQRLDTIPVLWQCHLPFQITSFLRINLNFIFLSSSPFCTLHPATGILFFPTVTEKMLRTEASPERKKLYEGDENSKLAMSRSKLHSSADQAL